jgi:phage terminase large subunit-like protein
VGRIARSAIAETAVTMIPPPRVSAADVIGFLETHCFVPEGPLVGQPIKLAPFQRDFIEAVYDNPHGPTRRAILSTGKKNAKTTLCACLLINHLCGPSAQHRPNSQLYSAAQSRDQASLIFGAAAKMIRMNPKLRRAVAIQETAKSLICGELGVRYKALSAEAGTTQGVQPQFAIHDELGQVRGPRSALFEALEMAGGALEDPLSIVISTQAPGDEDLLSVLLDDAVAGHDPQTVVRLYAAPKDSDPGSEEAIRAANPGLAHFMNKAELLRMAADASRMPGREAEFRNLILNQRVDASAHFAALAAWLECAGPQPNLHGLQVFGGLDLSSVGDLTAFVMVGLNPTTGVWGVHPTFWLPEKGLAERARRDRVPYDVWVQQGLIETTPGGAIGYDFVAHRLKQLIDDYAIKKIAYDPWGMDKLKTELSRAGFPTSVIEQTFVQFGQGYQSMSPAIRNLEGLILGDKLRHGMNPVMNWCVSNAAVITDPAGNKKFDKRRARGRIDGLIALVMALGVAPSKWTAPFDPRALIG